MHKCEILSSIYLLEIHDKFFSRESQLEDQTHRNPSSFYQFPRATDNGYCCIKVAIDDSNCEKEKDRKVERRWTVSISSRAHDYHFYYIFRRQEDAMFVVDSARGTR